MYIRNTWATRCLCVRMLNRALLTETPSRCNGYMYIIRSYTYIHLTHMCCKGQYTARFSTICLEEIKFTHVHTIYKLKILSTHTTHTHSHTRQQNATLSRVLSLWLLTCHVVSLARMDKALNAVAWHTYIHTGLRLCMRACGVFDCVCVCVFECVCAFDC